MLFTLLVVVAGCQSMALRPEVSRLNSVSMQISNVIKEVSSPGDSLVALRAASGVLDSVLAATGNATDHLSETDQELLRSVIALVDDTIYVSMQSSHDADLSTLSSGVDAVAACNSDIKKRQSATGDLGILLQDVQNKQTELNHLIEANIEKKQENITAWADFDNHMRQISDPPACEPLPDRNMPALDLFFEKSLFSVWYAYNQGTYITVRDVWLDANSALEEALLEFQLQRARRDQEYCDYKTTLEAACANFHGCFARESQFYAVTIVPRVNADKNGRIEVYKAGETLKHQIRFVLGEVRDQQTPPIDTAKFDIDFPLLPPMGNCDLSPLTSDEWTPLPTCDHAPKTVSQAWANHFNAFANQDLVSMMLDYDEQSVLQTFNNACDGGLLEEFIGIDAIRGWFQNLFSVLTPNPGLQVPAFTDSIANPSVTDGSVGTSLNHANVFLVWASPDQGIERSTDTFLWKEVNGNIKIKKQNIVDTEPAACRSDQTPPLPPIADESSPITRAWENHFAAFGGQDIDQMMQDYTEDSLVQIFTYDQPEGQGYTRYEGIAQIKQMFIDLWASMNAAADSDGNIGLGVPNNFPRVEVEKREVFLQWYSNSNPKATDTFLFSTHGKITEQLIVTTPAGYRPLSVAAAWSNHFDAFGAQDLDKIMLDYDDESVLQTFNNNCPEGGLLEEFIGPVAIRGWFKNLFEVLTPTPGLIVPMFTSSISNPSIRDASVGDSMEHANVFLVWASPDQGIEKATDTFMWKEVGGTIKIKKQHIVDTEPFCAGWTAPPPPVADENSPITAGWENHFAAFGAQDIEKMMLDYTEDSLVQIFTYDQPEGQGYTRYQGIAQIKQMFLDLWASMNDAAVDGDIGLGVPANFPRVEVKEQTVFLQWYSHSNPKATDTFLFNKLGQIVEQLIVTTPADFT